MLIIIGVAPCLIRDMSIEVQSLPREQMIKAQTLGASTWQWRSGWCFRRSCRG